MRWLPLVTLVAAMVLAGCGGGNDSASETSPVAPRVQSGSGNPENSPSNSASPGQEQPPSRRGLSPTDASPLPNQGTKAVAPGVPTVKGGDNSIQSYGMESDGSVRAEAASVLDGYLGALLTGDWSRACSLLAGETKDSLEQLASQAAKETVSCPEALESLIARVPKGPLRRLGELHVLSMRVQGDRGFLIYEDGAGIPSEAAMVDKEGRWKVRALIAKELLNSGTLVE